jgi:ketosteroid isomerase-like protein
MPYRLPRPLGVLLAPAAGLLLLAACAHPDLTKIERPRVLARLQHYSELVAAMDPEAIAAMYAPEGEMVNPRQPPVHGRAAIQKFLAGFADFHVLANTDAADSTLIDGDQAEQIGTYHQSVRAPSGKVFETSGRLEITWQKNDAGEWEILQLATFPAK